MIEEENEFIYHNHLILEDMEIKNRETNEKTESPQRLHFHSLDKVTMSVDHTYI